MHCVERLRRSKSQRVKVRPPGPLFGPAPSKNPTIDPTNPCRGVAPCRSPFAVERSGTTFTSQHATTSHDQRREATVSSLLVTRRLAVRFRSRAQSNVLVTAPGAGTHPTERGTPPGTLETSPSRSDAPWRITRDPLNGQTGDRLAPGAAISLRSCVGDRLHSGRWQQGYERRKQSPRCAVIATSV